MQLELNAITDSLYDLDQDIKIQTDVLDRQKYAWSTYHYVAESWWLAQESTGFTIAQMNDFLLEQGYRQMIKPNVNERPFTPSWEYRLIAPKKSVMANWLLDYYHHRLEEVQHTIVVDTNRHSYELQKASDTLDTYQEIYHWLFDHLYQKNGEWSTDTLMKWAFTQYDVNNQLHEGRPLSVHNTYRYRMAIYNRLGKRIQQYQEYLEEKESNTINEEEETK